MPKVSESTKGGMQARNAAVRRIISAHKEEYDRVLGDERESRGLSREKSNTAARLLKRKERLERQLAELNAQLNA